MDEKFKQLQFIFLAFFIEFIFLGLGVFILKNYLGVEDTLALSSKITMVVMIVMIAMIPAAYLIYDIFAKKSKKIEDNEEQQFDLFRKAMIIKMAMFSGVGSITAFMMFFIYQKTYLYILAIIAVFFLISFPNKTRFRRDFQKRKDIF